MGVVCRSISQWFRHVGVERMDSALSRRGATHRQDSSPDLSSWSPAFGSEARPRHLKARFVGALPEKLIGYRAYGSDPLDTGLASAASTSSHAISRRERSSRRLISDARALCGQDGGPTGGGVADFIPAGSAEHLHSSVPGRRSI